MKNNFIESFAEQSNLKNIGDLVYENFCTAKVTDKNGHCMIIFNIFEDIILYMGIQKIGVYKLQKIRNKKMWVLK